jgi:K+-sensing histidine kinase KdpD
VRAIVTAHEGEISSTARPTGGMNIAVHLPQTLEAPTSG